MGRKRLEEFAPVTGEMNSALRDAVRAGAAEHVERLSRTVAAAEDDTDDDTGDDIHYDCTHLLEALREAPGGIHPKVKIALKSIVEHVGSLERRLRRLETRR